MRNLLNEESRALAADGINEIQFDEPAFNVYMAEVSDWGIEALHTAINGLSCKSVVPHLLRLRHKGEYRLEGNAGPGMAPIREDLSRPRRQQARPHLQSNAFIPRCRLNCLALLAGKDIEIGVIDVATDTIETPEDVAAVIAAAAKIVPKERLIASTNCGMAPMRMDVARGNCSRSAKALHWHGRR